MSLFRRSDPAAEEILNEIVAWREACKGEDFGDSTVAVLEQLTFSAGVIVYRRQTENMPTDAAVAYIERRIAARAAQHALRQEAAA